jgi:hypothetical protein
MPDLLIRVSSVLTGLSSYARPGRSGGTFRLISHHCHALQGLNRRDIGGAIAVALLALIAGLWFVFPQWRRRRLARR